MSPPSEPLLAVRDLRVSFRRDGSEVRAVDGLSLDVGEGRAVALVGESGSGKSLTALALLGLAKSTGASVEGSIRLAGREIVGAPERELAEVRGERIAMVFQEPGTALDPVQRVGRQVAEQLEAHGRRGDGAAPRAVELLDLVGLPQPERVARSYPFELSGGMRQRAMIAMAISCEPDVLIADEPTSALDVVTQAEILTLLDYLRKERGMALIVATHDLRAVASVAERVAVIEAGRIVEEGPAEALLREPREPYTRRLVRAPGTASTPEPRPPGAGEGGDRPVLEVTDLEVRYRERGLIRGRRRGVPAVDGVTLTVAAGETLGLVGRSGCGKTSVARAVLRLLEPVGGSIRLEDRELAGLSQRALRPLRRTIQAVFQDPAGSLNPRRRVGDTVGAPLRNAGADRDFAEGRARELLARVELPDDAAGRFPHELSGGQRQRVAIARALALEPRLIVLDEPVSALDAPVRAQVMDLLAGLQRRLELGYLLISHDLDLVGRVADRVVVMDAGRVVEAGRPGELVRGPEHRATRALVDAAYAAREAK